MKRERVGGIHRGVRASFCILLAVAGGNVVGACGPKGPVSGGAVQRRDSAGVEIVESGWPTWGEGEAWRISPEVLLRIGVVEGEAAYQFTGITGAVRLTDGTTVVADAGSEEVRFFGPDGEHVATVGRAGGGPGEFTGLSGLGKDASGGIWAYDFSLRRITWMDRTGGIIGMTSLGLEPAMLNAVGALPDSLFLLKQLWGAEETSEASRTGLRRDPVAFVRFDPHGTLVDTVGLFPGREVYITEEDGRGVMSTPPFARNSSTTLLGDRLVVGTQDTFELLELDPEGTLLRLIRISGREAPIGPEELESYIQGRLRTVPPEDRPGVRRSLQGMPVPESLPPYGAVKGDEAGNLWVGEWAMYPDLPERWEVFSPGGDWLGTVRTPRGFAPSDIGSDWVLGVERDELDVEYVALYRLIKGEEAGT